MTNHADELRAAGGIPHPFGSIRHVILDRDGVLNEEPKESTYITNPAHFRWLPGACEALADLRTLGLRISVATNQSCVGRGLVSEAQLNAVHLEMCRQAQSAGGAIDAVFCCPHAPQEQCGCRKPAPGLIASAMAQSGFSPEETLVVGDDRRDLEAARRAGTSAVLLRTGKGTQNEVSGISPGTPVFDDLPALVRALATSVHPTSDRIAALNTIFTEHLQVVSRAAEQLLPTLAQCILICAKCVQRGHKLMVCGNGGSAADAQHFVAELVGRYRKARPALPAMALTSDPATFTALSNDFGYEQVFARQIEAFAQRGDVLIALSTSGNSPNIVQAAIAARGRGCMVIALTGQSGGQLVGHAERMLRVPSDDVARIQEVHGLCLHALAQAFDDQSVEAGA